MCPRRLRPDAAYHAVIVPAFETGRLAGLGEPIDGVPAQKPSWGSAGVPRPTEFPVYYRWSFRTGTSGDFESLVRALVARPATETFGRRAMDVSRARLRPRRWAARGYRGSRRRAPGSRSDAHDVPGCAGRGSGRRAAGVLDLTGDLQDPNAPPRAIRSTARARARPASARRCPTTRSWCRRSTADGTRASIGSPTPRTTRMSRGCAS